jgi:hypothetical protein
MAEPARSSTAVSHDEPSCDEWLRRVAALTVAPPSGSEEDERVTAGATAAALVRTARALVADGVVAPERCGPGCAGCAEPHLSCALVRDLAAARLADGGPGDHRTPLSEAFADVESYRAALARAAAAVSTCRRTLHVSHSCLFGSSDLCGRVLAEAHRSG